MNNSIKAYLLGMLCLVTFTEQMHAAMSHAHTVADTLSVGKPIQGGIHFLIAIPENRKLRIYIALTAGVGLGLCVGGHYLYRKITSMQAQIEALDRDYRGCTQGLEVQQHAMEELCIDLKKLKDAREAVGNVQRSFRVSGPAEEEEDAPGSGLGGIGSRFNSYGSSIPMFSRALHSSMVTFAALDRQNVSVVIQAMFGNLVSSDSGGSEDSASEQLSDDEQGSDDDEQD